MSFHPDDLESGTRRRFYNRFPFAASEAWPPKSPQKTPGETEIAQLIDDISHHRYHGGRRTLAMKRDAMRQYCKGMSRAAFNKLMDEIGLGNR